MPPPFSRKAICTNIHFVDIVRPSLEDFQPIALHLRLALLGIYIAKYRAASRGICKRLDSSHFLLGWSMRFFGLVAFERIVLEGFQRRLPSPASCEGKGRRPSFCGALSRA